AGWRRRSRWLPVPAPAPAACGSWPRARGSCSPGPQGHRDALWIEARFLAMKALRAVTPRRIAERRTVGESGRRLPAREERVRQHLAGAAVRHVLLDHEEVTAPTKI